MEPQPVRSGRTAVNALVTLTVLLAFYVLALFLTGGFALEWGALRLSSRNPKRPFIAYAAILAIYSWRYGGEALAARLRPLLNRLRRHGTAVAASLAIWVTILGLTFGTYVASGADAYGYVSQARLWTQGSLHVPTPLAADLPWPHAEWSVAPLGYRPATIPNHIVPTYAPGLPLLMAAASYLHPDAVYVVVPILGGLLIWLSYCLGRQLGGTDVGLLTAVLMASSPVFMHHIVVPMSDVPAAAFWTASMLLTMSGRQRSWVAAGVMASVAILIRPNTVVLAAGPLASCAWTLLRCRPQRLQSFKAATAFAVGMAPGMIVVAIVNDALYGSPFLSGYGRLEELYALRHAWTNVKRFAGWTISSETPMVLVAILGGVALWRASPQQRQNLQLSVATMGLIGLCYLFYLPFDVWPFLRFLLPGIPFLLALSAVGVVAALRIAPSRYRVPIALLVLGAAVVWRLDLARGAFDARHSEQRYVSAAQYIVQALPENAVVLSMQHSGTIRHYAGRQTVRWDAIDAAWFDRAPEILRAAGLRPYILVEDWEESELRNRLGDRTRLGALDWKPVAELRFSHTVRIYDPADAEMPTGGLTYTMAPDGFLPDDDRLATWGLQMAGR